MLRANIAHKRVRTNRAHFHDSSVEVKEVKNISKSGSAQETFVLVEKIAYSRYCKKVLYNERGIASNSKQYSSARFSNTWRSR